MKKRLIFNFFSIIFLLTLVIFYGYRLFYYYMLEHKTYENKTVYLYEKLIDSKGIIGTDKGLIAKDNTYIYTSKSDDNYLYYVGRMWRIISIDEHNNIKMITEEPQTLLTWNENELFNDSDINKWLNKGEEEHFGIFEDSLKEETNKLMKQNNKYVTLLTEEEYNLLNQNNFLVGEPFWIIGDDELPRYVNAKGNVENEIENTDFYGVRPVIALASTQLYLSGSGTLTDPYIITDENIESLSQAYVGEYVNFSNFTWKIINTDSEKIKIALDTTIENTQEFSKYDNEFYLKEGIGKYLNTDFYDSLQNNDYIVTSNYYNGSYTLDNNYSYLNTFNSSVEANIGLYSLGEFFIDEVPNTYTLTPYLNTKKTIYTINSNNKIYADLISSIYNIRPVLYLDSKLFIIDGNGTKEKPYEIGR